MASPTERLQATAGGFGGAGLARRAAPNATEADHEAVSAASRYPRRVPRPPRQENLCQLSLQSSASSYRVRQVPS